MKTCAQNFKTHLQIARIQVQNNNKQHLFFLCALEFQSMKDETLKRHCGDKPPQTHKKWNLVYIAHGSNHTWQTT
jgi:hypothetical protein